MCVSASLEALYFGPCRVLRLPICRASALDNPGFSLQATAVEPAHLQYREQYMSKAATADMDDEQARGRVHEVIRMLDKTFDVPSTTEGIEVLTHVRTDEDLEQVLQWLGPAIQQAAIDQVNGQKPLGWSTPAPSSAKVAADAWMQVRTSSISCHLKCYFVLPLGFANFVFCRAIVLCVGHRINHRQGHIGSRCLCRLTHMCSLQLNLRLPRCQPMQRKTCHRRCKMPHGLNRTAKILPVSPDQLQKASALLQIKVLFQLLCPTTWPRKCPNSLLSHRPVPGWS